MFANTLLRFQVGRIGREPVVFYSNDWRLMSCQGYQKAV